MRTQQAAEREEQQRIKNLVLNYDLRDGEDQDGDSLHFPVSPNYNIHDPDAGIDKAAATNHSRPDKSGNNRSGQRARKLQLSDVDWYAKEKPLHFSDNTPLSENSRNQSIRRSSKSSTNKPLGGGFLPNVAPPRVYSGQSHPIVSPRKTGKGKLSRKEILKSHAAFKPEGDK